MLFYPEIIQILDKILYKLRDENKEKEVGGKYMKNGKMEYHKIHPKGKNKGLYINLSISLYTNFSIFCL